MLPDREDDVTDAYERMTVDELMAGLDALMGPFGRHDMASKPYSPKGYAETDAQREEYGLGAYARRGDGQIAWFPDLVSQRQQFQGPALEPRLGTA